MSAVLPNLGSFHPLIIHFVVALGFLGILLRVVSLTKRLPWTSPSATLVLLIAAGASVVAVESGEDAHGLVERIPGVRQAVSDHQELGEDTRTLFLVVAGLELVGLALHRKEKFRYGVHAVSAVVGLVTGYVLFETADHGGDLVYSYAGGPGLRTGDTTDVRRLLIAGLFQEARVAREAGDGERAYQLTEELARQRPTDPNVTLLIIGSRLEDLHDASGALAALDSLQGPADDPMFAVRKGLLTSQALVAAGRTDSARAVVADLIKRFPQVRRLQGALDRLK